MARRSPQTQAKRQREVAKKQKRQEKQERRALRKRQKAQTDSALVVNGSNGFDGSDPARS